MFDKSILEGYELVPIEKNSKARGIITIDKCVRKLHISSLYANQLGWKEGERLDLRRKEDGTSFCLVPSKVGLVKVGKIQSKARSISINCTDMCHKIRAFSGGCSKFEGWVADDMLFFKPMKGEE